MRHNPMQVKRVSFLIISSVAAKACLPCRILRMETKLEGGIILYIYAWIFTHLVISNPIVPGTDAQILPAHFQATFHSAYSEKWPVTAAYLSFAFLLKCNKMDGQLATKEPIKIEQLYVSDIFIRCHEWTAPTCFGPSKFHQQFDAYYKGKRDFKNEKIKFSRNTVRRLYFATDHMGDQHHTVDKKMLAK